MTSLRTRQFQVSRTAGKFLVHLAALTTLYRMPPFVGTSALIVRDDRVLVVLDPIREEPVLPGGHLKWRETLRDALIREVWEETGIDAKQFELRDWELSNIYEIYPVWRHRYAPGVTHNTEHVFGLCVPRTVPVHLAPREYINYVWLPYREAADRCFSPSNAEAILQLPQRTKFRTKKTMCP